MARSIQQIYCAIGIVKLQHCRGDGDAALLLQFHPIGCHLALFALGLYGTGLLNCTSVEEQFFGEGGLAGIRVGNDRKVAAPCHRGRQGGVLGNYG